jgi:hypothetical protein
VEHPPTWRQLAFWSRRPAGFSFEPARRMAENTRYVARLGSRHLLGRPATVATLDTLNHGSRAIRFTRELRVARTGTLHGIGGWFTAQLSPGVRMTNSPLARGRISRLNAVFPIARPVALAKGDRVRVSFVILPRDGLVSWIVEIPRGAKAGTGARTPLRFVHSTLKGMFVAQEDLARSRPDAVPVISARGRAEQTVLALCDGRRSLTEVEAAVLRAHPRLFQSEAAASVFVAAVIARSAE